MNYWLDFLAAVSSSSALVEGTHQLSTTDNGLILRRVVVLDIL